MSKNRDLTLIHLVLIAFFENIATIYELPLTTHVDMSSSTTSSSSSRASNEYREQRTPPPASLRRGLAGPPSTGGAEAFPSALTSSSPQSMEKKTEKDDTGDENDVKMEEKTLIATKAPQYRASSASSASARTIVRCAQEVRSVRRVRRPTESELFRFCPDSRLRASQGGARAV